MKHIIRSISFLWVIVLILSTFILPVFAYEDAIQPYLQITSCPSCDADDFRSLDDTTRTWYDTPTRCDLHAGIVDDSHQHRFTEEYTLYRCYTCGYEKKFDYIYTEYCPVMDAQIGYSL